jgi:hypothetical protein
MFNGVDVSKAVTVKVPSSASYDDAWQEAFKGQGQQQQRHGKRQHQPDNRGLLNEVRS